MMVYRPNQEDFIFNKGFEQLGGYFYIPFSLPILQSVINKSYTWQSIIVGFQ